MTVKDTARIVLKTLTEAGFESYFVGGCVRDYQLGFEPKDWDITTSATPEEVNELFPGVTRFVGANFGVSLVRHNHIDIEVATFRTDGAYLDGRHPDSVKFTKTVK
jgi:tRNA nucleotidyltransferase (CCA-adding enzyme)